MDDFEKIKDKTGISKLDRKSKKQLFDKFVDHGGEVISERKKRVLKIDRERQKQYQQKLDEHRRDIQSSPAAKSASKKNVTKSKTGSSTISSYFTRLKIRFKLKIMRVTQFNGFYFNLKFLQRFNNIYKPALMEIQMMFLDIFKKDPQTGNRVVVRLDQIKPLYYEVIEMIGNLYDKMTTDQIVEHYKDFPDVPKKVSELNKSLMEIYRRLYILNRYENTIYNSFEKALEFHIKIEEKKSSSYHARKKKIKNCIYIVFNKLYPRLHWLFCHYQKNIFDYNDPEIEDILSITAAEKPGNRVLHKSGNPLMPQEEDLDNIELSPEEAEKEENDLTSKELKRGLQILYLLNLQELREKYDKSGLFQNVSDNDKVFITYLLFNEFDHEYSCVLTTNKIKYNVDFGYDGKLDYRIKMQDLYDEMRKCTDSLKNYAEVLKVHENVKSEKPIGNNQYIRFSKRLEEIQTKRKEAGRVARMNVAAYMKKISEEVRTLITDLDAEQKYIANPQEILEFDTAIEGEKKINGRKVYEAILILYYFALALSSRLELGGDLSGSLEFKENEVPAGHEHIKKERDMFDDAIESEDSSPKSILDELDDML